MTRTAGEIELDAIDATPWLARVEERFGIPAEAFDGYVLLQQNRKTLALANADQRPCASPAPLSIGLAFMHTDMLFPKLTTGATLMFGHLATRNVIELTEEQATLFLQRQPISPAGEQLQRCTSKGYVILTIDGVTLGQGLWRPDGEPPHVESFHPKARALHTSRDAFSTGQAPS